MNTDEFSRCIALLEAYWPHGTKAWTTAALEAWETLLVDLDARLVAAAIQVLAADGREFPPPPGLIRRRALEIVTDRPGGGEAWAEVCDQIRRVGSKRGMLDFATGRTCQPVWSDPLVGEVADRLGWDELCQSTNPVADRAHFLRLWGEASERQATAERLPPASRRVLEEAGIRLPDLSIGRCEP